MSDKSDSPTAADYGARGGKRRAERLSPEERSNIARSAAAARWSPPSSSDLAQATHGSPNRPLVIGDIHIPCYVLADGRRVIVQSGIISALGMTKGGSSHRGGTRLAKFASGKGIYPFVSKQLVEGTQSPIFFRTPAGGLAFGFEATILADLCDAVLDARKAGVLQRQQEHIAERAETLVRGFARVGIVALVDEATGFQEDRERDALHKLLAVYLSEERLAWAKRFPNEFYKQLYRLKSWPWPTGRARSPLVGKLTNKLVYDRLPDGVLAELRYRNPTEPGTGRRRWKHHQFLSEDIGQPDLRDHLLQLVAVMRVSKDWKIFERNFEAAFPRRETQIELEIDSER